MARKNRTPEEKARREKIRELLQMANISSMDDIQNLFKETIAEFMENGLEAELEDACRRMLQNWKPYILNAFDIRLSNGFTEGCNNAIKALKRVAFGFRSFRNFRARILLSLLPHPYI